MAIFLAYLLNKRKDLMQLLGNVPDFSRPIEALYRCHEGILRRMMTIETMARQIIEEGEPAFTRQHSIWLETFHFISENVANHTRDEEEGLFPLLAQRGIAIQGLLDDHDEAEQTEAWLAGRFEALSASGADVDRNQLNEFAERALWLTGFYHRHIDVENTTVFPEAEKALNADEKHDLSLRMHRHRRIQITLPSSF